MKNVIKYGEGVLLILAGLLLTRVKAITYIYGGALYTSYQQVGDITNGVHENGQTVWEQSGLIVIVGIFLIAIGTIRIIKERLYEKR